MPVDVLSETVIDRPCAEVSAYAADPDNAPRWYVNIESVDWKTPPPLAKGSRVAFVAHFLGRRLAYTYEMVDLSVGSRHVMRTAEGPFPIETTYTWEAVDAHRTRRSCETAASPRASGSSSRPSWSAAPGPRQIIHGKSAS
jgi:hypothetical protein